LCLQVTTHIVREVKAQVHRITMSEVPPSKKIKFSPSNVDHYERVFMHMHNVAMGYEQPREPRPQPSEDIRQVAMRVFPCPSPMRNTFQAMIATYKRSVFDCFLPPAWLCDCYKCQTWQKYQSECVDVYEESMDIVRDEEDRKLSPEPQMGNMLDSVVALAPETMDGISLISVSHVFLEMPAHGNVAAATPKFSIPSYVLASDQGKTIAQEKWIARMRMTPNRLIF